jgi:chemotaxis protein methyltransferase CheR
MTESRELSIEDIELDLLMAAVFHRHHFDFRNYAQASLRRRVQAAMLVLKCATISRLQETILRNNGAFEILLRHLTVQVTDMFRDPPFFQRFRSEVVPLLQTYPSIRIWVAGCSTGEEVYSYAVILREEGLLERTILYATDINEAALGYAGAGTYPLNRVREFCRNHQLSGSSCALSEHYLATEGGAIMHPDLKKRIVFADHSLATDSVFAEVQVASCRNVLIYFNTLLQERALSVLSGSLGNRGFLGLGNRETLQFSHCARDFEQPFANERWYRKK